MEKRISYSQFQQVKSAAKMIDPLQRKMQPLRKKIEGLVVELKSYQTQVDALEAGIVSILGFHVSELVKKVIEPTGKTDANGKPLTITKYLPTNIVSYDEHRKEFVITVPDNNAPDHDMPAGSEDTVTPPTTADSPGSDYDLDAQTVVSEASPSENNNMPWNN